MIAYTSILWPEAESPQLNIPLPPEENLPDQGLIDSLREELSHSLSRKHNSNRGKAFISIISAFTDTQTCNPLLEQLHSMKYYFLSK